MWYLLSSDKTVGYTADNHGCIVHFCKKEISGYGKSKESVESRIYRRFERHGAGIVRHTDHRNDHSADRQPHRWHGGRHPLSVWKGGVCYDKCGHRHRCGLQVQRAGVCDIVSCHGRNGRRLCFQDSGRHTHRRGRRGGAGRSGRAAGSLYCSNCRY